MSEFGDLQAAHQRLTILRLLEKVENYTLNDSMIQDLMPRFGHDCSRDCVRTNLAWLREQGLVTLNVIGDGAVYVAKATARGCDVAKGRATVPGVKRPSAGD